MAVDWDALQKVLVVALPLLNTLGLGAVLIYDRWKGTEVKGKEEQIKTLEQRLKHAEGLMAEPLLKQLKATKEAEVEVCSSLQQRLDVVEAALREQVITSDCLPYIVDLVKDTLEEGRIGVYEVGEIATGLQKVFNDFVEVREGEEFREYMKRCLPHLRGEDGK
jgi:hypothetical protein